MLGFELTHLKAMAPENAHSRQRWCGAGVIVTNVEMAGEAELLGLRMGDRVHCINGEVSKNCRLRKCSLFTGDRRPSQFHAFIRRSTPGNRTHYDAQDCEREASDCPPSDRPHHRAH